MRGKIVLPTGTGKTYVQCEIVRRLVQDNGHMIVVVVNHRILLSYQLILEYMKYLMSYDINAQYINFNSGDFPEHISMEMAREHGLEANHIPSTTEFLAVSQSVELAKMRDIPVIICSTYDSAYKLLRLPIDLQINDEAHFLTERDNFTAISESTAQNILSFTATPKGIEHNYGRNMGNLRIFGDRIYGASPRKMIEKGEMLRPAIHIVHANDQEYHDEGGTYVAGIIDAFNKHEEVINSEEQGGIEKLGGKVLITFESRKELYDVYLNSNEFDEFEKNGINVFALATYESGISPFGIYNAGDQTNATGNAQKYELLKKIRSLSDTDRCAIMHVDMVSEGIDVPGITGIMPFRNMEEGKFTQNLGRALRCHVRDRQRLYGGDIDPSDHAAFIKPYGWIIIPAFASASYDFVNKFKEIVGSLVSDEYFSIDDLVVVEHGSSLTESAEDLLDKDGIKQKLTANSVRYWVHELSCPDEKSYWHSDIALANLHDVLDNEQFDEFMREHFDAHGLYPDYRNITVKRIKIWAERKTEEHRQGDEGTYDNMEKTAHEKKWGNFREETIKRFGAVYTPDFVVDKTISLIWDKINNRLYKRYIDPACGDGNFLINLYHRLMKESFDGSEVEKSEHILTKCLYGIEILKNMWYATKVRLCIEHFEYCKKVGVKPDMTIFDRLNIIHGDTILTEDDPQPTNPKQGGLVGEEIENDKWDIIIGNPPYTHQRGIIELGGPDYHRYNKQKDMAQKFVRWALDHLTDEGICAYNITDIWLLNKLGDGARATRLLVKGKIRMIETDDNIISYSMGSGGDLPTTILVLSCHASDNRFLYNGQEYEYTEDDLLYQKFVTKITDYWEPEFRWKYIKEYGSIKTSGNGTRDANYHINDDTLYFDLGGDKYYLVRSEFVYIRRDGFRNKFFNLIKCSDIKKEIGYFKIGQGAGVARSIGPLGKDSALCLLGWFNTTQFFDVMPRYLKMKRIEKGGTNYHLIGAVFKDAPVPDFDYYKKRKPQQFQRYVNWIEASMHNKDELLDGIDEQFRILIEAE